MSLFTLKDKWVKNVVLGGVIFVLCDFDSKDVSIDSLIIDICCNDKY